jgi:ABC-type multidrug transport system fused ATPase/permease subunit
VLRKATLNLYKATTTREGLSMINNQNAQVVALELWRFCAHCIAIIVVVGAVLIGFLGSWDLALKVGVLPLLALVAADALAKRREHEIQVRNS